MSAAPNTETSGKKQPPVILCIGMAGSGKTTFMQVKKQKQNKIKENNRKRI